MADIGANELKGPAVADLIPGSGQEFPPLEMGLAVGGKLGDMHPVFVPGSDHHQAISLQVPGLIGEASFLPSPLQPQTEINPNYIWKNKHTRLDYLWQTMGQDRQGLAMDPESVLRFWGAAKESDTVSVELHQGKRNLLKRETGEPQLVTVLRDKEGNTVREYGYEELRKLHGERLKKIETERLVKAEEFRYLVGRNRGSALEELGYRIEPASSTSGEVVVIDKGGHRFSQSEFERHVEQDKPGVKQQIENLAKMRGNKKQGFKEFITKETRFGRAVNNAFGAREAKRSQKAMVLAMRQYEAEKQGSRLKQAKNVISRGAFAIGRPFSFAGAATRATVGMLAYDYNPLRPLFGSTIGRAWTADWGNLVPHGELHDKIAGISFRELAGRIEEKFLTDPITGEHVRTPAISEKRLRQAVVGGVEWGVKMQLLPNLLSQMPAIAALNLNPGEIWSMYRSANMVRNSPGSVKQFYELLKHAESKGEQAKLMGLAAVSAPLFLVAEKATAGGVVNPVLMFDVGLMRLAGEAQRYMAESGMVSTKFFKALEAIEVGITGAFAFDSLTSLTTRVETYVKTGSLDPLSRVTSEKQLLDVLDHHSDLAMGESSIFGRFQRLEHAILAKIRPEMAAQQRMVVIPDEQGEMAHYTVIKEHEDVRVIKSTSDGIAAWEQGIWTEIAAPKQPVSEQVPGQELIGLHQRGAEPVREEGAPQGEEHEVQADLAEAQQLAQALIDETEAAVHDYVVFSEDGGLVAMRLDLLAVDGRVDAYESVAQKVDRLFAHITPMPIGYGIDDSDAGLSGEQVRELASGSPELEAIAGADNVYESQLRHAFIDRLLADARANGLTYDLNLVKTRMVAFLEQGFIDDRTVEGEVEYASVYRYLFADAQTDFAQADRDADPQKAYFLTERELNPEIVIEVKSGTTVGQLLREQGYAYSDLVTEAGTVVYRMVGGQRQPVGWEELDSVYAGDVFVIDRIPDDVERDLDIMPEIIGSGVEPVDASEPGDQHVEPEIILPVELTFDVLRQLDPVRSPDGEIYIGEIQPGQYMSQLVNQRFEGYVENPWATIYRAFENELIDLYTVNEQGDVVRDFRESDMNSVFAGEKLMISDPDRVLESIKDYEAPEVNVPAPRIDMQTSDNLTNLELELERRFQELGQEYRFSLVVIDPDNPEETSLVINENEVYYPASLQKLYVAMLIMKDIEKGEIDLDDRSQFALRPGGYQPTFKELLIELVINSDDSALNDLTAELTGIHGYTDEKISMMDSLIQTELGLQNTSYGNNPHTGGYASSTAHDMAQVLLLLQGADYLNEEHSAYLLELLEQSGRARPLLHKSLEILPGINVAEKIGEGFVDENGINELHTMGYVTDERGKQYAVVIMSQGQNAELELLIKDYLRFALTQIDPEITTNQVNYYGAENSYNLENSRLIRRDYIDHFLHPLFAASGEAETINPEVVSGFPGGQVPAGFSQWSSTMQAFADATTQVTFQDPSDAHNVALYWLDPQQNVLLGLNSQSASQAGVRLVDWHGTNQDYEYFAESDFEPFQGEVSLEISEIHSEFPLGFSDADRQAFIQTLHENSLDSYDFIIFPGVQDQPPMVAFARPASERSSGALSQEIRIGVVNDAIGLTPDSQTQTAIEYLVTEIGSWQRAGDLEITTIDWEWGGEEVNHHDIALLTQERWYSDLAHSLNESLFGEDQSWLHMSPSGEVVVNLTTQYMSLLTEPSLDAQERLESILAMSEEAWLRREYDRLTQQAKVMTSLIDRPAELVGWQDFRSNFWREVSGHADTTMDADDHQITVSRDALWLSLGLNPSTFSYQGSHVVDVVYVPEGSVPRVEAFTQRYDLSKEHFTLLPTRDSTLYLVGEHIEEGHELTDSYEIPANMFMYQYRRGFADSQDYGLRHMGNYEYLVTSQPLSDSRYQLTSVLPLARPLETYVQAGPFVSVGNQVTVRTQYQQDAYLVPSSEGETVAVMVDQRSLRAYGEIVDAQGNFEHVQALVSYPLSYEEIAKALELPVHQGNEVIPQVIEHRLLQTIALGSQEMYQDQGSNNEDTQTIPLYQVRGDRIVDLSTQGSGGVQEYFVQGRNPDLSDVRFDEQFRLQYHDSNGETFIFNREQQQFVQADPSSFQPVDEAFQGSFTALSLDGKPLMHKGMPLFVGQNELIYTLDATGLVAVDSLYSRGAFETTPDDRLTQVLSHWGITQASEWQEARTFNSLATPEEKLLHGVAMIDTDLVETQTGLFDPQGQILFQIALDQASNERLVDRLEGRVLLAPVDMPTQLYALNDEGELERFSGSMVTEAEYINNHTMEAQTIDESRKWWEKLVDKIQGDKAAQLQLIDRKTRMPVYAIGDIVVVFGARGLEDMGDLQHAVKNGIVGLPGVSGGFDTLNPDTLLSIAGDSKHFTFQERIGMQLDLLADAAIDWLSERNETVGHFTHVLQLTLGKNYVTYDELPRNLVHAIISSEDERLLSKDTGSDVPVSMYALFRAAMTNFQSGASNIPQQLGRNLELSFEDRAEKDVSRKFDDWIRAAKLQGAFTPENILEMYVNVANYGADGVALGAQRLFGKELPELNLAETTLLTVMPKNPGSFSMGTYESASLWADMAAGVARRMNENGYIDEGLMKQTWRTIYDLILPSGLDSDIEFLQRTFNLSGNDLTMVRNLAGEYQRLDWEKRWIDDPNSTDPEDTIYRDFFAFVAEKTNGTIGAQSLHVPELLETYYAPNEMTWQPKFEGLANESPLASDQIAMIENFSALQADPVEQEYISRYLREGRTTGPLLADFQPSSSGSISIDPLAYRFEALQTDSSDTPEVMPVIATTQNAIITRDAQGQLWNVTEHGLEKLPSELYVLHHENGTTSLIQSQPANVRESVLTIGVDGIARSELVVDAAGNYYRQLTNSQEVEFIGRTFPIGNQEVLVATPPTNEFISATDRTDPTWAAVVNGFRMQEGDTHLSESELIQAVSVSTNPNLGATTLSGRFDYVLANPSAVQSALESLGQPSTAITLEANHEGIEVFKHIVTESVNNQRGMVVWWKPSRDMLIKNVSESGNPLYEQTATQERPVTILGMFTFDGKQHVLFDDPNQPGVEQAEWSAFMKSVAPTSTSSIKALVLDDMPLPANYSDVAYAYNTPARQLEMAWYDPEFSLDWANSQGWFERMVTSNATMQQWVESEARTWMSPTTEAFRGIAMDGRGNVIFATGIDRDGNEIAMDTLFTQAFTPGSVFKIPTVLWGLHHGLEPDARIQAGDAYELPWGTHILNWTATYDERGQLVRRYGFSAPSTVTPADLLKHSSNTAAFDLYYRRNKYLDAAAMDPDSLLDFTAQIGFGSSHSIPGMPNNGGLLPTDDYAIAHPAYGAPLDPVFHGQQAFGQHDVQVTLSEMLRLVGAIANDGVIIEPNIVRGQEPIVYGYLPNSPEDLAVVREGMHDVAMESGGTAFQVFGDVRGYTVYGKTGTAEMGDGQEPHAWFVGWAEDKNSGEKIVFAFMFEHGGEGSQVAAPAVRHMLDRYFSNIPANAANTIIDPEIVSELERVGQSVVAQQGEGVAETDVVSDKPEVLGEVAISAELPRVEDLIEEGRHVSSYATSPNSFFQLQDRSVSELGLKEGGAWNYYRPADNIEAGNRIYDWLSNSLNDEVNNNVEVSRLGISQETMSHVFSAAQSDEIFDVLVTIGDETAEKTIVITSHYDTRPEQLGSEGGAPAQGASDNGWTVAMNMQLAQKLAERGVPEGTRVIFAFTTGEEIDYDTLTAAERTPGARELFKYLTSTSEAYISRYSNSDNELRGLGLNPENIMLINTDGLVNVNDPTGRIVLFNPQLDPRDLLHTAGPLASMLDVWFQAAGIDIGSTYQVDRNERWGDQGIFHQNGVQNIVRLTTEREISASSEEDLLPEGGASNEVLERTGRVMWALERSIYEIVGVPIRDETADSTSSIEP